MKILIKRLLKKIGVEVISQMQLNRNDAFYQLEKLLKQVNSNIVFDIGAATGSFATDIKAILPGSVIFAFEPQLSSYNYMQQHCSSICKPYQVAFSDAIGEQNFYITHNGVSSSLLKPSITGTGLDQLTKVEEAIIVKTDTIDNFCSANEIEHIHLLKLDVQGGELNALKGAKNLLQKNEIDVIYTEVEFMSLYENQPLYHDIAQYLSGFGYKLYNIYNLVYIKHQIICWGDAIFVKKELYETTTA